MIIGSCLAESECGCSADSDLFVGGKQRKKAPADHFGISQVVNSVLLLLL